MENIDKIEKIVEKTGMTYEEAKQVLDSCGGDLLEAMLLLESQGKVRTPAGSTYSTQPESSAEFKEAAQKCEDASKETFGDQMRKIGVWFLGLLRKGRENFFIVSKDEKEIINIPVLLLAICLIAAFWLTLIAVVAGLFMGYRYSFRGNITKAVDVNTACSKAADAAETIKQEFNKL